MIVFTRTASIAPGKNIAAIGFAHQIAAYLKTSFGNDWEVLTPIGGNPNRITWSSRAKNLAEFEERQLKLASDQKYMQLVASGLDNFVPGTMFDTIWRAV